MTSSLFIDNALQADEKIIWRGNPPTGIRIQSFNLLYGGFAIVMTGPSFFTVLQYLLNPASLQSAKLSDIIFNIIAVIAGIYVTIGLLFTDAKIRAKTAYAITNKRILITSVFPFAKLTSIDLPMLQKISYQEKADGSGTIIFEDLEPTFSGNNSRKSKFKMIPEVRKVYELTLQVQQMKA